MGVGGPDGTIVGDKCKRINELPFPPSQELALTLSVPTSKNETTTEIPPELFRHTIRPEWGMAVLVRDKKGRRTYQFEDGKVRKFRKDYFDLLEVVEPHDGSSTTHAGLVQTYKDGKGRDSGGTQRERVRAVGPFVDQVRLFERLYPEGFAGQAWIDRHRGGGEGPSLKRHREGSMAMAREVLSVERCASLVSDGDHARLAEGIVEVLGSTTLVPATHVKLVERLDDAERKDYAGAVANLLWGEGSFDTHFRNYLQTLRLMIGKRPSWRVATALQALVHPDEHVCVRRTAFARQAGALAPRLRYSKRPGVKSYTNYRKVAEAVKSQLEVAGHEPRDFLDVHDFVWTTLRKSAISAATPT